MSRTAATPGVTTSSPAAYPKFGLEQVFGSRLIQVSGIQPAIGQSRAATTCGAPAWAGTHHLVELLITIDLTN